jgi:hypothetical protein
MIAFVHKTINNHEVEFTIDGGSDIAKQIKDATELAEKIEADDPSLTVYGIDTSDDYEEATE